MSASISLVIIVASVFSGIGLFAMCLCKAASDADDSLGNICGQNQEDK